MSDYQDELYRDYGTVCEQLSERFGTKFYVASTGGGCYAIAATLETGDLILITDADDASLNPFDLGGGNGDGYGVGIYDETDDGNEQVVYVVDTTISPDGLGDLVALALREHVGRGQ